MQIIDRIFRRIAKEAEPSVLRGAPIVASARPIGYIDRQITAEVIASNFKVQKILSSVTILSKMALPGFDWNLSPIEEGDDTQGPRIKRALSQIKKVDKTLGRIGKRPNCCTLDFVRATMRETLGYRQAFFEWSDARDGTWQRPDIQHLPAKNFNKAATKLFGQDYIADTLLPGVVYDRKTKATRYFQGSGFAETIELDPDHVLYVEDLAIPDDTSFMASLVPTINAWREVRTDALLAMRRIGVPNEVAQLDADALAKAKEAGIIINPDDLLTYAKAMVEGQSIAQAKLSMIGMSLEYPEVKMPLNPWEADKYLKMEMIEAFFARDITEQLAAAVSSTSDPTKALLDQVVVGYQEVNGQPWEQFWYDTFLEPNGFGDLQLTFDWWSWTPKDQKEERNALVVDFRSHAITVNEYRRKRGYPPLSDEEIKALAAEHGLIFGSGAGKNVLNPSPTTV